MKWLIKLVKMTRGQKMRKTHPQRKKNEINNVLVFIK